MFYSNDPQEMRSHYFLSWQKYQSEQPLNALEKQIVAVIEAHKDYDALFSARTIEEFLDLADYYASAFLHFGLHLAIRDQLSLDKPTGILKAYHRLVAKYSDLHHVEHLLMEQLQTHLWNSFHGQCPINEKQYLEACQTIR